MLVYVRQSDKEHVMCAVREDMAPHLQASLAKGTPIEEEEGEEEDVDEDEQEDVDKDGEEDEEKDEEEEEDRSTHVVVRVATHEDLCNQVGKTRFFDLVDHSQVKAFRVSKEMRLTDFQKLVEAEWGVPVRQQVLWTWEIRENGTYRPATHHGPGCEDQLVSSLSAFYSSLGGLDLFLQVRASVPAGPPSLGDDDMLLFFKLYDPVEEKLSYVGQHFASSYQKMADLMPVMRQLGGYTHNQPLEVYQEIGSQPEATCLRMREKLKLTKSQLGTGDILCFQKALPTEVSARCRFPDVPSFFQHARQLQHVRFRHLANPKKDAFVLVLSITSTYDEVVSQVASQLQKMGEGGSKDGTALDAFTDKFSELPPIRLTAHDCILSKPKVGAIECESADNLMCMLTDSNWTTDVLYYEVLERPQPDLGLRGGISISVHDLRTVKVACFHVPLPRTITVADVFKLVKAERECAHLGELVAMKVHGGRVYKVLSPTEVIDDVDGTYWTLQIAEKEAQSSPSATLLPVSHVRRDEAGGGNHRVTAFGQPFLLAVDEQEKLASVKSRLRAKLGMARKSIAKCKFAIMVVDTAMYLGEDDVVLARYQALQAGRWEPWLCIQHPGEPKIDSHMHVSEDGEAASKEAAASKRPEARSLRGLEWKCELFSPTFVELPPLPRQDPQRLLQEAASSHVDASGCDMWQLARQTQSLGRTVWDTMLELFTLRTSLRTTDEEVRRLLEASRQTEATLKKAVAAVCASPLDAAALSARDRALAGQVTALRQLEESYARKAMLAGERVKQKQMLEGMSRPGSTDVTKVSMDGPERVNPSVDGQGNVGQIQGGRKPRNLAHQRGGQPGAEGDMAQVLNMGYIQHALALAGVAIKECNEQLMPAASATCAAVEQLFECLALQRTVMAGVKGKLDKAHDAGTRVVHGAIAVMDGETPAQDAEQAATLRALVQRKREQLAEVMAAREGLHPTEVRMGVLQRDLRNVKKQKAQARAHLEIAEIDEKHNEAAELRKQLAGLEDQQRGIMADLNKLTVEAEEATHKMTQYYPEVVSLPERASRLGKALPSSSNSGSGGDIVDPDWSLACFRDGMGRPLGSSRIRMVEDREGNSWVIKELCGEKELRREGSRLQALQHPLVIRLERIFFDGGLAYLQMPYCKNGSLRTWFERIKGKTREGHPLRLEERQQVWVTMRQVFQAVAFIHRKGVVHRDLKPENILLQDDGQIALCDFGVSHDASRAFQTTLATRLGGFTTAYAAPEVFTHQPSATQWPFSQDMWSLGVMLTELLTGSLPVWNAATGRLEDAQGRSVLGSGSSGSRRQPQGDPWMTSLQELVSALVQVDPAERPSAEDALSDPQGFLARDLTQMAVEQQRRMHALSSFLESMRRCPARVTGRAHVLLVSDLGSRRQLVQQVLEAFAADGLDLRVLFSVECGGIRVPLSEVLDRFFQAVVLPEAGLFEQGREGREDIIAPPQLQEGVAFLPRKMSPEGRGQKKQHLRNLRVVGRVLAKAILECLHVPVRFATALCCFLVGDEQLDGATPSRCLELMAEFDPVVAGQMRSVLAITHGNGQEHAMMASMLTRCAAKDDFAITDANKGVVVRQAVHQRLFADRSEELGALRDGFLSLDDLMADHVKLMTGEVLVTLFFGQDYLDVDKVVTALVFPEELWGSAKEGQPPVKDWLRRFLHEVSETGLRLLCLRALGGIDALHSGHTCLVLPGGRERELPVFERETGCLYMPEVCQDYTVFQARMHRALRAGEYGVRTGAQQEERLAKEEMDAVVGAMRGQVRAGGWYRCPNGHPYAIGECGGAMVEAMCPTCGSGIGGLQHRLRGDNQNALDIDGAAAPAWN
eukprot:jgi/Mesvir1/2341/Mv04934-RA.1